jgi:hypothetical protein
MNKEKKRGPASNDEITYIIDNAEIKSISEMAEELGRTEVFVRKYRATFPGKREAVSVDDFIKNLHATPFWVEIKKCLLGGEIKYFEQQWASYMRQFSAHDILATDEMMTKDLIMLEIMCNRALKEKASAIAEIERLESLISNELQKSSDMRDAVSLTDWQQQVNALRASLTALSSEFTTHQKGKDDKLRDLKATRKERYQRLEQSKRNFFELIMTLDDIKQRHKEGLESAKVAIAAQKLIDNWSENYEYEDGTVDAPFLSPEGMLKDEYDEEQRKIIEQYQEELREV